MNADGSEQTKVTANPDFSFDRAPAFSPDGTRIVFMSDQDGPDEIRAMNTNGSGQTRLTDNGIVRDASPAFSPSGKKIAFESNREGNFEIYKMRSGGTGPVNLTNDPAGDFTPDWQPLERLY